MSLVNGVNDVPGGRVPAVRVHRVSLVTAMCVLACKSMRLFQSDNVADKISLICVRCRRVAAAFAARDTINFFDTPASSIFLNLFIIRNLSRDDFVSANFARETSVKYNP